MTDLLGVSLPKTKLEDLVPNRLLVALPPASKERLLGRLQLVPLSVKDILYHRGDVVSAVYFPRTCVVSLMAEMQNGETIEIATVGNEGVLGVSAYLGITEAVALSITQVSGDALRMSVEDFKRLSRADSEFESVLHRYMHTLLMQIALSGGCNSFHSAEERYIRWLLMMHERTNTDVFDFTQEFLSRMLGVSRARVSIVTRQLEKAGLIDHGRNRIRVLDWQRLELSSCDCYRAIKQEFGRVISESRKV